MTPDLTEVQSQDPAPSAHPGLSRSETPAPWALPAHPQRRDPLPVRLSFPLGEPSLCSHASEITFTCVRGWRESNFNPTPVETNAFWAPPHHKYGCELEAGQRPGRSTGREGAEEEVQGVCVSPEWAPGTALTAHEYLKV